MPNLIKIEEDNGLVYYAIRRWGVFNYEFLSNCASEFWYSSDWDNKDNFSFDSEQEALTRWNYIMSKRKIKRKITVIKNL